MKSFKVDSDRVSKKDRLNPLLIGALGVFAMLGFYIAVLTFFESLEYAISQFTRLWYYMLPLLLGFGIQLTLHQYIKNYARGYRNITKRQTVIGGSTSASSMVLCCAHHFIEVLPLIGLTALTSFLVQYQEQFLTLGLAVSMFSIFRILSIISKNGLYDEASKLRYIRRLPFGAIYSLIGILAIVVTLIKMVPIGLVVQTDDGLNSPVEETINYEDMEAQAEAEVTTIKIVSKSTVGFEQEGVTYDVTFLPLESKGENWIFEVILNTHFVDLSQLDLSQRLTFKGALILKGEGDGIVVKREGSGHHVSDYILVPKTITEAETITSSTTEIELVFSMDNGSESLKWTLQ